MSTTPVPQPQAAPQQTLDPALGSGTGWGNQFQDVSLEHAFQGSEQTIGSDHPQPAPASQPQAAPQVPEPQIPAEPFLRADTGTVYMDLAAAKRGTEEKDRVIAESRQQLQAYRAFLQAYGLQDPLSGQQTFRPQAPVPLPAPRKLLEEVDDALESGNPDRYEEAHRRIVREEISNALGPLMPLMQGVQRQQALATASQKADGLEAFLKSDAFQRVTQELPTLGQAIAIAEMDVRYQSQLPDLYRQAYLVGKALEAGGVPVQPSIPSGVPALPAATPVVPQTQPPVPTQFVRPTMVPSRQAPQTIQPNGRPLNARNANDRKALIQQGDQSGILDAPFSDVFRS